MTTIEIATVLHSERPPKSTRMGAGVSGALWVKWRGVVDAFAATLPESERATFLRACEVDGKAER